MMLLYINFVPVTMNTISTVKDLMDVRAYYAPFSVLCDSLDSVFINTPIIIYA